MDDRFVNNYFDFLARHYAVGFYHLLFFYIFRKKMGSIGLPEIFLIIIAAAVVACISYLSALQRALKVISPENRKMKPVNVWLLCIPAFNILYIFTVVDAIANSFKQEYDKYGTFGNTKSLYWLGVSIGVLNILSFFWGIAGIASMMCLAAHWIRVNQCKNEILQLQKMRDSVKEKSLFFYKIN